MSLVSIVAMLLEFAMALWVEEEEEEEASGKCPKSTEDVEWG